jgi:hypothetical protein
MADGPVSLKRRVRTISPVVDVSIVVDVIEGLH